MGIFDKITPFMLISLRKSSKENAKSIKMPNLHGSILKLVHLQTCSRTRSMPIFSAICTQKHQFSANLSRPRNQLPYLRTTSMPPLYSTELGEPKSYCFQFPNPRVGLRVFRKSASLYLHDGVQSAKAGRNPRRFRIFMLFHFLCCFSLKKTRQTIQFLILFERFSMKFPQIS